MMGIRILVFILVLSLLTTSVQVLSSGEERAPSDPDPDLDSMESNEEVPSIINEDEDPSRNSEEAPIWPRNGFDNQNTRRCPYDGKKNLGEIKWKTSLDMDSPSQSPVIDDKGMIYFSGGNRNWFYSISPNGSINYHSKHSIDPGSPYSIYNGIIYIGSNEGLSAITTNDELLWTFPTDRSIRTSPIMDKNDNIYFGGMDNYFYSIFPNGSLRWKYNTKDWVWSNIALYNNTVFFGSNNGFLYCFYLNGTLKWKHGGGQNIGIDQNGNIYSIGGYNIYALYENGTNRWKYTMSGDSFSTPAFDNIGNIFFGDRDRNIYSLYSNGTLRWKYKADNLIATSALVDINNYVYILDHGGVVYSLNNNGTLRWKSRLGQWGSDDIIMTKNGDILVPIVDGGLYCLNTVPPNVDFKHYFNIGSGYVNITWEVIDKKERNLIEGYHLYRSDDNLTFEMIENISFPINNYNDTSVINGITYYYYLVAFNNIGSDLNYTVINATPRGPPTIPLNVTVIGGPGYLNLSWKEPLLNGGYPVEGYHIYRKESGVFLLHGETNDSYFIDLWANQGVNYSYYITAVNEYGESIPTPIFWGISIGVPPPPYPLTIGRFDGAVNINWSSGIFSLFEYDITHVRIYRNGTFLVKIPESENYYNDTGLINRVVYKYQISSVNILGEGDLSDEFEAVPGWSPSAPRNLTTWANTTMVKISWDPPEFIRGFPVDMYIVYRKTDDGRWINLMNVPASNDPHWNDTYVEMGNTYEYKVIALNQRGASPEAGPVSATIPMGDPPERPEVKSITLTKEGKIEIEWNGPQNEEVEYSIFRKIDKNETYGLLSTTIGLVYSDTPITKNVTYYYYIIATNQYGNSPSSEVLSIFVPAPGPDGNGGNPENNSSSEKKFPIIPVIIAGVILLILLISLFIIISRRKKEPEPTPEPEETMDEIDQLLRSEETTQETPVYQEEPIETGITDFPIQEEPVVPDNENNPLQQSESVVNDLFTTDEPMDTNNMEE